AEQVPPASLQLTPPLSVVTVPWPAPIVTSRGNCWARIVVGSEESLFEPSTSPPPDTEASFVTDAAAFPSTSTVTVIAGKAPLPASASERVQVALGTSQVQPLPLM